MSREIEPVTVLMRPAETERAYSLSHVGLYRLIKAGHIEAIKIGRSTFIVRASVENYLASLPRLGQKVAA